MGQSTGQELGRHRRVDIRRDRFAKERQEFISIQGVGDGLPHQRVVQGFDGDVKVDGRHFAHPVDIHQDPLFLAHPLDPDALGSAVDHVQLARLQAQLAAIELGHVAVVHAVQLGPAAEVILVGHQHDILLRAIALEHEGTGADGVGLEGFGAQRFIRLLADDEPARIVGDLGEKEHLRKRRVQGDLDRALIDRFDRHAGVFTGVGRGVCVGRFLQ